MKIFLIVGIIACCVWIAIGAYILIKSDDN